MQQTSLFDIGAPEKKDFYLFFDTETTGNTEKDFLTQIAYKTASFAEGSGVAKEEKPKKTKKVKKAKEGKIGTDGEAVEETPSEVDAETEEKPMENPTEEKK